MAATFSKPIIYPRIGNFEEQADGWVSEGFVPGNVESAVGALHAVCSRIDAGETLDNTTWLKANSWRRHVDALLDAL